MKEIIVRKNAYKDSVTLMSLSNKVKVLEGVSDAVVAMGTDMNKEFLRDAKMSSSESDSAGSNDLIIAIDAKDKETYEEALKLVDDLLASKKTGGTKGEAVPPKGIMQALDEGVEANLVLISVPGDFAAREARIALENNLHVMIFSDNVSMEDEKELKELGREKGLLVMGPDCGTASINNVALCFCNVVRKGSIGIVAAAGTGLQEVMVQIHRLGGGISQAIGTGGRDLKEEIGGIMMLEGLKALGRDEHTEVIVLVSKPPAKSVAKKILEEVARTKKPVVVCFLDGAKDHEQIPQDTFVYGLADAARVAVEKVGLKVERVEKEAVTPERVAELRNGLQPQQKYLRGLYCGGTLCAEALSVVRSGLGEVRSNVAKKEEEKLASSESYTGNVLIDLGEDEFTKGKPHPMIEPSLRLDWIMKEAKDPEVGVILLDFELGFGSHEDPAGVTIDTIKKAKKLAADEDRGLVFVAYICGTDLDKQNYEAQRRILENEGVVVLESNTEAASLAKDLLA
ncbi:MAG TPA: acyl-CoA synthetase FdrA [Clostridiaceae bacterium]|nr:acyl-CoA synthetase FdrA [Clostridiaceae bacterium]